MSSVFSREDAQLARSPRDALTTRGRHALIRALTPEAPPGSRPDITMADVLRGDPWVIGWRAGIQDSTLREVYLWIRLHGLEYASHIAWHYAPPWIDSP